MLRKYATPVFFLAVFLTSLSAFAQDSSGVSCNYRERLHPGRIYDSVVRDHYAFVRTNDEFIVVDITNPASPQEQFYTPLKGGVTAQIALMGNYALITGCVYVPQFLRVVYVFDISNPVHPILIDTARLSFDYNHQPKIFALNDSIFSFNCSADTVTFYRLSSLHHPVRLRDYVIPGFRYLAIADSNLNATSLVNDTMQFLTYRFISPDSMQWRGSCNLHQRDHYQYINQMVIDGHYAYVPSDTSLVDVIDIANPDAPTVISTTHFVSHGFPGIAKLGNYLYLYGDQQEIHIVDVSNPSAPVLLHSESYCGDSTNSLGCVYNLFFSHDTMFIVDYSRGLWINRIQNGSQISELGGYFDNGDACGVAISNNHCYLADGTAGLRIYDVSGTMPVSISQMQFNSPVTRIDTVGHYAYIFCADSILIYDISNLTSPVRSGGLAFQDCVPIDMAVSSHYAYIRYAGDDYLKTFDVANPAYPILLGSISIGSLPYFNTRLLLKDSTIYLATDNGLETINISHPDRLTHHHIYTNGECYDFSIHGNTLYCGTYDTLWMYDIANPDTITVTGYYHNEGSEIYYNFLTNSDYLFGWGAGLRVLNVSDPVHPHEVGFFEQAVSPMNYLIDRSHLYSACGTYFNIYDVSQALGVVDRISTELPQNFELKQNYPNPFNNSTTIEYSLPTTSHVNLKVFDVQGREIGTLVNFLQHPGTYRVQFDGRSLASGTYFLRLQAGSTMKTQKLMLLK